MKNVIKIMAILIIVVVILAFVPIVTIWALNTLFHLGIPYALNTWAAILVLFSILGGTRIKVKT